MTTERKLGSPPKSFYTPIDNGSTSISNCSSTWPRTRTRVLRSFTENLLPSNCELYRSSGVGFAPAGAHGFHGVAFADIDTGLLQALPNFFMLALGREVGFL